MKLPRAPSHLSKQGQSWWRKINEGWLLDDSALLILETALESFDRMKQAKSIIDKEGVTVMDKFNQVKEHPAIAIERKSRDSMVRCLKALNLQIEPLHDKVGRPGGK